MRKEWELWSGDHYIIETGRDYEVREKIEELLEDALGFFVMLQENTEDDEFKIYLHSDNETILTDDDFNRLSEFGLDIYDELASQQSINRILNIYVC